MLLRETVSLSLDFQGIMIYILDIAFIPFIGLIINIIFETAISSTTRKTQEED